MTIPGETSDLGARRREVERARSTGDGIAPSILESWQRSEGVDARSSAAPVDAEPDEVRARWEASPIRRSGVDLEARLAATADAAGLIAAVTDEDGRILWSAGSPAMQRTAEQVGFVPGGRWDEGSAGTNALGMALATGRPSTVFAAEHWCESVSEWVCWSAPVVAPDGRRLGVVDLSGPWSAATPIAELAVTALAEVVQRQLPDDAAVPADELVLRVLGRPEVVLGGRRLSVTPRQMELLAALALAGPSTLEQLQDVVYGDRPVSAATIKAEMSHLRRLLGGAISSRPYGITIPVRVDAAEVRVLLGRGDLAGALAAYTGQLLPDSEAPFAIEHRHVIDGSLRRSLLSSGDASQLLRFATVHRYDEAVLERAIAVAGDQVGVRAEALSRLEAIQL